MLDAGVFGEPIHCLNPSWSSQVSITSQGKSNSSVKQGFKALEEKKFCNTSSSHLALFTFKTVSVLYIHHRVPIKDDSAQPTQLVRAILHQNMQVPPVGFSIWSLDNRIYHGCYLHTVLAATDQLEGLEELTMELAVSAMCSMHSEGGSDKTKHMHHTWDSLVKGATVQSVRPSL